MAVIFLSGKIIYDINDIGLSNEGAIQAYSYIKRMVDNGFITADITFDIAKALSKAEKQPFISEVPGMLTHLSRQD